MTAIRYCFLALLIEGFLVFTGPANAGYLIALQWTKPAARATLHCNVDRYGVIRLPISPTLL
jgi:hypothetical protein